MSRTYELGAQPTRVGALRARVGHSALTLVPIVSTGSRVHRTTGIGGYTPPHMTSIDREHGITNAPLLACMDGRQNLSNAAASHTHGCVDFVCLFACLSNVSGFPVALTAYAEM
jgi:hypothetical protein